MDPDGTLGLAQATYRVQSPEPTEGTGDALVSAVDDARARGLTVEVGGDALKVQAENSLNRLPRHELALGRDPEEAAGRAVSTAGSTVVFAGLTVVIALAALSVVGLPFLTQMGLAAAGTVAIAVVIALTLLPALLGLVGRRIVGGHVPGLRARDPEADGIPPGFGTRWARAIARRPVAVLLAAVSRSASSRSPRSTCVWPCRTTERRHRTPPSARPTTCSPPGSVRVQRPLTVVVDSARGSAKSAADAITHMVRGLDDVAAVTPAVVNQAGDTAVIDGDLEERAEHRRHPGPGPDGPRVRRNRGRRHHRRHRPDRDQHRHLGQAR